jgi:sigma-B regulation protein RsbU (phosphoserine phosphatase)
MSPTVLAVGPPNETQRIRLALESFGIAAEEAAGEAECPDLARFTAAIFSGPSAVERGRRLSRQPLDERPLIVYMTPDYTPSGRLAGFASGADAVLPAGAEADEIAAQARVFERWHSARRQWRERTIEAQHANQQLQIAYRQIELDLTLARRLQASFLPRTLPAVGDVRFGVCYRPCGQVGGDFYDVVRLDERHVGFYVADAMGHGVPASLLTIFLKRAVQPKEISGTSYRLLSPDEVLGRLNRDLMSMGLAELPFITMIYGLIDCQSGMLRFARAAHPHPVYVPRQGEPQLWQTSGTLLGIFDAEFPAVERQLQPGDKLLLFTDGQSAEAGHDPAPILAAAEGHRGLPIQALVERISDTVLAGPAQADDFTLLGMEMAG